MQSGKTSVKLRFHGNCALSKHAWGSLALASAQRQYEAGEEQQETVGSRQ